MRKVISPLSVCALLLPPFVSADTEDPETVSDPVYLCQACGDPFTYFVDYGNFAFNALWGKSPWIGTGPGKARNTVPLRISNLKGQMLDVFVLPSIALVASPSDTFTIKIELPNRRVVEYEVLASRLGEDLPVGASGGSGASSGGGGESRELPGRGSGGSFVGGGERGGAKRCGWGIAGNKRRYRCLPR